VLELSVVTTIHTALPPGQFWTEYNFDDGVVVLDEQLDVDVPSSPSVTLKVRPGYESEPRDRDGRRVYHWVRSQLKGAGERKAESDETNKKKPERATGEPEVAAIRLTTFQTWEQVGRWYAALEAPQRVPTTEVRKKAAELTAGRKTDIEKLEALYDFVATNFRYVSLSLGAGRYQPRQAGAVLQDQYGDCKDKHTLLASLIDAAGLKASAVLISTAAKIDPEFPSPSQFNHVITLTAAEGQDVWLDTTSEVAPFQLLLSVLRNKQGLVVDAKGPRLQQTPANPPMKSLVSQDVDATLGSGGNLDAHVRMTLRGDIELVMRAIFRSAPPARWKEVLEGFVKAPGERGRDRELEDFGSGRAAGSVLDRARSVGRTLRRLDVEAHHGRAPAGGSAGLLVGYGRRLRLDAREYRRGADGHLLQAAADAPGQRHRPRTGAGEAGA